MPEQIYRNLTIEEINEKKRSIYADKNITISHIDNDSDSVIIIFAFAMALPRMPRESLHFYTKNDKNIIHIVDSEVSFFNNFTAEFVIEQIKDLIKDKKVYTTGMSMGGFEAVYLSNFIKVEKCLAIGPQYTILNVDPKRFNGDFKFFVDRIENLINHTIKFDKDTEYLIILGGDEEERISSDQTIKMCKTEDIDASFLIFRDAPHLILDYLNRQDGPIDKLIESFLHDDQETLKEKYSHYSTHMFKASDDYNYS
jgi:hypothetical protein